MTLVSTDKIVPANSGSKPTYRQFLATQPEGAHTEWVNGEVIQMAPISDEHQSVGGFLLVLIRTYVTQKQLGVVLHEPFQMKTGRDLPGRSPDILFVAESKRKQLKKNHLEGPADLVVEIISPGSIGRDRGEKFYEYERGGVREYWLIDPQRKQAEFYSLGKDGIYRLTPIEKDGKFHSKVLTGFWLKPDWLWQRPLPAEWSVLKLWKLD
jgi:Uma2 family endonuclease